MRHLVTTLSFALLFAACSDDEDGGGEKTCDCPKGQPCVDFECLEECPEGRVTCGSGAGGELSCCKGGEKCCAAGEHGYAQDICAPSSAPCPVACAPEVACASGYCQYDAPSDDFICIDRCPEEQVCGDAICCPVGSRCVAGGCPLPDLTPDPDVVDTEVTTRNFSPQDCTLIEDCVDAPGNRLLLRFDTRALNLGPGDLHIGEPEGNALLEFSSCHGHYHFTTFARYDLYDLAGTQVVAGHKQAFCLVDLECDPEVIPLYSCQFQGIRAGCADIYAAGLDCQWIDVTDLPSDQYRLVIELNFERQIAEADYSNNRVEVPIVLCRPEDGDCADLSSCPGGCRETTEDCCADGDPCGLAGDGVCDCDATQAWNEVDCAFCDCAG